MKIGDKVKVIKLDRVDEQDTDLKIGDIGIITAGESYSNVLDVRFGNELEILDKCNMSDDGSYSMWRGQLEVVTD